MSHKKTAVIVIPTYNEKEIITKMIDYLFTKTFVELSDGWIMKLLIVDGNSPDGTSLAVKSMQDRYENLQLLVEQGKEGIGAAYVKGFRYATEYMNADVLIEFDGDFQHPPETIPLLLHDIDEGYDYVLGSRWHKEGSYPSGWGLKRNLFSKLGGFVARCLLFLPTKAFFYITDPTTSLKATRVNAVYEQLDMDNLYTKGFGYKLELLFQMVKLKAKIKEIPLHFKIRETGESKMTSRTPVEIFKTVFYLRFKDPDTIKFIKFMFTGFFGFVVNAGCLELFNWLTFTNSIASFFDGFNGVPGLKILANKTSWDAALAVEMSIINNFLFNNFWTFSQHKIKGAGRMVKKFLTFNLTSLGALVIQFAVIGSATLFFGNTPLVRQLSLMFSIVFLCVPYNWLMYNKIIWKVHKKDD